MTFGDVLAVIALVTAVVLTLCCSTVVVALVTAVKGREEIGKLRNNPIKFLLKGAVLLIAGLVCFVCFHNAKEPPVKILSGLLLLLPIVAALRGSAILVALVAAWSKRPTGSDSTSRELFQSALLCLGASLSPLVGWLVVAPTLLCLCLGAGIDSLLSKAENYPLVSEQATTRETVA